MLHSSHYANCMLRECQWTSASWLEIIMSMSESNRDMLTRIVMAAQSRVSSFSCLLLPLSCSFAAVLERVYRDLQLVAQSHWIDLVFSMQLCFRLERCHVAGLRVIQWSLTVLTQLCHGLGCCYVSTFPWRYDWHAKHVLRGVWRCVIAT